MPRVPTNGSRTARDWLGTAFGDAIQRVRDSLRIAVHAREARYWCGQIEVAPDTGREHLQFFVRFKSPKRRNGAKAACGDDSVHLEIRAGTPEEARAYCTKDDTRREADDSGPWEEGAFNRQGQRTDLEEIRRRIADGATDFDIAESNFTDWCRYRQAFSAYRDMLGMRRAATDPPEVRVYWGPTGSGKTRSAWDEFPDLFPVPVPARSQQPWFDGYVGQDVCLIDDFEGSEYRITFMLRLLDRYPMAVPIKGAFRQWSPSVIIITSNVHPRDWYPDETDAHRAALLRRLTSITHYNDPI